MSLTRQYKTKGTIPGLPLDLPQGPTLCRWNACVSSLLKQVAMIGKKNFFSSLPGTWNGGSAFATPHTISAEIHLDLSFGALLPNPLFLALTNTE